MTEDDVVNELELLKRSYDYFDHHPQTTGRLAMLKDDEDNFIDNTLFPYLKQIVERFTSDLRNPVSAHFNILPGNEIQIERISAIKTSRPRKPQTQSIGKAPPSDLRVFLSDGQIIQEYSATETMCSAIRYAIDSVGIEKVLQAEHDYSIVCDKEFLLKKGLHLYTKNGSRHIGDGYYLNTHMSTITKKQKLDRLGDALGLHWTVSVIENP